MRNTNWTIIALALLAAAALFYFMKQSDFMKTGSAKSEMATSMDVEAEEMEEMEDAPEPNPYGPDDDDDGMMMMSEEEAD